MWNDINCKGSLMDIQEYLTVEEIAKQLGLTEYRIRELIREKQIRATKIGRWRIKPEDLERVCEGKEE